ADLLSDGRLPEDSTVAAATLARYPLILYERGGSTREIVDGWFDRAGIAPRPVMELGSVEAIKVLVGGGFGASVLPGLALGQAVAGTEVLPLRPPLSRPIGLAMRREKLMERGLKLLIEELERAGRARNQAGKADSASRT
ncbi:MAG TPA: LysR family transcriptional regulator substrate-binding protein, partial [Acetobacteraceae bacterium]|nr:LysR family transcriptional regulator substrate-binding protein [Acetobacteraceae bacterium]